MEQESKLWWQSRTIWANVFALLFAIPAAADILPEGFTQEQAIAAVMALFGIINIFLSAKTTSKPIAGTPQGNE